MNPPVSEDNMMTRNEHLKIVRKEQLAEKIVIVDGQPGCGKTMLSPIMASMERVELLSYAFEIEFICRLFHLNKIDADAAVAMVRMFVDHKLYQTMMGRDTNFRYSDLSSAFKDANPWRYIKRIFGEGDIAVPERIKKERPILNLTTHDLLSMSTPVLDGLGDSVLLIEVVRHPLYMVKQQQLNMERLIDNARDIQIYIEYKGEQLPYFTAGWEEQFINANSMEKAIFCIDEITRKSNEKRKFWLAKNEQSIITIPFEKFVIDPWPYIKEIEMKLGTTMGSKTHKIMKKQNVPRKVVADSPALNIYKRCGWIPPSEQSEKGELNKRRSIVAESVSSEALAVMDMLSEQYTQKYLSK